MTHPPVIRIFFAIDLPTEVKQKMGDFISDLKKQAKSHAIRWTKPENLHITLQFLAEVRREDVEPLIQQVRNEMTASLHTAKLTIGSLHLFPNPYRPRVIVLDISPQQDLEMLAKSIAKGIQSLNYSVDPRPFRAHLTLGRIKYIHRTNLNFLTNASLPPLEDIELKEVILFRSEPQQTGSKYTIVERMRLTNDC